MSVAPVFPFYDLFCAVRSVLGLTMNDYLALLEALQYTLRTPSSRPLEELILVCQLLWAKTPEACEQIDSVVRQYTLSVIQDYQQYRIQHSDTDADPIESRPHLVQLVTDWLCREDVSIPVELSTIAPIPAQSVSSEAAAPDEGSITPPPEFEPVPDTPSAPPPLESPAAEGEAQERTTRLVNLPREPFGAEDEEETGARVFAVPAERYAIAPRRARHVWRLYRLPQRRGALEFSLPDTIASIERHGGLPVPVYRPRITNQVNALLLIDVGIHMNGFQRDIGVLLNAFVGSAFHRRHILYYDGYPEREDGAPAGDDLNGWEVYTDDGLEKPIRLAEMRVVLGRAGVLIVGDPGAAANRSPLGERRFAETMTAFVTMLRLAGSRVVWLNPRREEEWHKPPVPKLRQVVSMHPYTDQGLETAVNTLRGIVIA